MKTPFLLILSGSALIAASALLLLPAYEPEAEVSQHSEFRSPSTEETVQTEGGVVTSLKLPIESALPTSTSPSSATHFSAAPSPVSSLPRSSKHTPRLTAAEESVASARPALSAAPLVTQSTLRTSLPAANVAPDFVPQAAEVEIELPSDAQVPAVLADDTDSDSGTAPKSPAQQAAADSLVEELLDQVAPANPGQPTDLEDWNNAVEYADERYRSLFGQDAFLKRSVQAARDALSTR